MSSAVMSIGELIESGETASCEVQSTLADSRRLVETITAMATIGGGVILVGVRDDGTVIGAELGDGEIERLVQRILAGNTMGEPARSDPGGLFCWGPPERTPW